MCWTKLCWRITKRKKYIINRISDDSLEIVNENIRQIIHNLTMNDTIDTIIEGNN